MIDANKLQYFTMAAWLRGYASGLYGYENETLKHKLNKAADMLDYVFGKYVEELQGDEDEPLS